MKARNNFLHCTRIKRRFSAVCFTILLLAFTRNVVAQDGSNKEWDKVLNAAKKEGQVTIYGPAEYEKVFAEFQKKYPEIAVKGFFGRSQDVGQRIMAELRASKHLADLFIGGTTTAYTLYKGRAFDPIIPALILPEVTDQSKWWQGAHRYVDPEGQYLFVFNGESRVDVVFNTNLVNPKEFKSFWDILNPRWKGKIVAFDPKSAGPSTDLRFMYYNPALGPEFLKQLFGQMEITISRDVRQMGDWLGVGKFSLSVLMSPAGMDLGQAKSQGLPVDWFGPKDLREGAALTTGTGCVALVHNSPHPNAARAAISWLLSREGQMAYQRILSTAHEGPDSLRIDIPKDKVPSTSRRVDGVKYIVTDKPEWIDVGNIRKLIDEAFKPKER